MLTATLPLQENQGSDYESILRRKGRTFYWASRLFGKRLAADIALLYAFCRHLDDLADDRPVAEGRDALEAMEKAINNRRATTPIACDFVDLAERCDLPLAAVLALIDTLKSDTGRVRMRDWEDVVRYGYGAAGTVGVLFCVAAGVREREALPFAVDLGVAMQLTNIARDVLEDAERGRLYLPLDNFPDIANAISADRGAARETALEAVDSILTIADYYYRSADRGMRYLPWRTRAAVLTASRCYEAIGGVIRRRGSRYWSQRCYVGTGQKLWHTARALSALLFNPRYWRWVPGPRHASVLHLPLAGLPGTNPCV